MSFEIVMPRAGLTMVEGTISEWKVAEGAFVSKGETLMEFENEKNVIPCDALESGILHIIAEADETVEVGKVIGILAADKAEYDAIVNGGAAPAAAPAAAASAPAQTSAPAAGGKPIVMPRAGLTMVEGTISEWKVAEGAFVNKGEVIMEFENEKNVVPCEALDSGIIHIIAQADETVEVGNVIGILAADKAEYDAIVNGGAAPAAAPAAEASAEIEFEFESPAAAKPLPARVRATGYAKKLAAAAGIQIADVPPTGGPDGLRIVAKDVQAYLAKPKAAPAEIKFEIEAPKAAPAAPAAAVAAAPVAAANDDVITETPWTGVRKTIAKNMFNSLQQSAQTTSVCEVDVTDFLALRKKLVDGQDVLGAKITVNDLLIKLFAKVVVNHPFINATFDGKTLYSHSRVHMSIAVGAEHGLMVPVIKNVDKMSIVEISKAAKDVGVRAKNKQLRADEQSGGTFTISNVGMFPIDFATPVINPPQTAIVGIGRTVKKPVVMPDGSFAARDMMHVFLTFDHRVIDGLEAGKFFADMEKYFKNPELILA